jgi:chromate reductase, NAD(P)H dehydrogenase (quinone)
MADARVVLISGSLRAASTNSALLRTAAVVAPAGIEARLYEGMGALPHFNPDDDSEGAPLHPAVVELRAELRDADAVLFCTPEYAGALPGSFKNLLDWTVGGGETHGKPVAWVNVAGPAAPNRGADAHESLRKVLGYTGSAVVPGACRSVPVTRDMVGGDGLIDDRSTREQLVDVLRTLAAADAEDAR